MMPKKFLTLTLCLSIIGELKAYEIPDEVMVGPDPISAAEFSLWEAKSVRDYEGIYRSDVGGDTSGFFAFKIDSTGSDEGFCLASGELKLQIAGEDWATTIKLENILQYGSFDRLGIFDAGVFRIFFVHNNYSGSPVKGVIINNVLLRRVEHMAFIDGESNFRTGPGTRSQIKYQPANGSVGTVIGREGNWIMIELSNGDVGWAHKQNLRAVR